MRRGWGLVFIAMLLGPAWTAHAFNTDRTLSIEKGFGSLAFEPGAHTAVFLSRWDDSLTVVDLPSFSIVRSGNVGYGQRYLEIDTARNYFYINQADDNGQEWWEPAKGQYLRRFTISDFSLTGELYFPGYSYMSATLIDRPHGMHYGVLWRYFPHTSTFTSEFNAVRLSDFAPQQKVAIPPEYDIFGPCVLRDGYAYYSVQKSTGVIKVRLSDLTIQGFASVPDKYFVAALSLDPSGSDLYALTRDLRIVHIRASDMTVLREASIQGSYEYLYPETIELDPVRGYLYVTTSSPPLLMRVRVSDLRVTRELPLDSLSNGMGIDLAAGYLYHSLGNHFDRVDISTLSLSAVQPSIVTAGSGPQELILEGKDFYQGSVAQWNGDDRPTRFIDPYHLGISLTAADLSDGAIVPVRVYHPAPEGLFSEERDVTITNPLPILDRMEPSFLTAGDPDSDLRVHGAGFTSGSRVFWNGAALETLFVSSVTLAVKVPASALIPSVSSVTVYNHAPEGGTSDIVLLPIRRPDSPLLNQLSPDRVVKGSSDLDVFLEGENFRQSSTVQWNGRSLSAQYLSAQRMKAVIPAAELLHKGTSTIRVVTPWAESFGEHSFVVQNPSPALDALSPDAVTEGKMDLSLILRGREFIAEDTSVQWEDTTLSSQVVDEREIRVSIPASRLTTPGRYVIQVMTSDSSNSAPDTRLFEVVARPGAPRFMRIAPSMTMHDPIEVESSGSPAEYAWTFEGTETASGTEGQPVPRVIATTPGGVLRLQELISLTPGRYQIRVLARNRLGAESPAATAEFTLVGDSFHGARVYPNPWDVAQHRGNDIQFDRLPPESTVRLFSLSGYHVRTLSAPAGSVTWNLRNAAGDPVASGLYLYVIESHGEQKRGKMAVIQ